MSTFVFRTLMCEPTSITISSLVSQIGFGKETSIPQTYLWELWKVLGKFETCVCIQLLIDLKLESKSTAICLHL